MKILLLFLHFVANQALNVYIISFHIQTNLSWFSVPSFAWLFGFEMFEQH